MESADILQELLRMADDPSLMLSAEQIHALVKMQQCRTIAMGGRIAYCTTCDTHTVLYNPCNQRGCPICYEKNQIRWKQKLQRKLLPTGHYHLIFTLPELLSFVWLADRKCFGDTFFHCVRLAFKSLEKQTGVRFGIVMVFQTHGRGLSYKPHMHCIVTPGGMNEKGKWVTFQSMSYNMLRDGVKEHFGRHLLKKIRKELRNSTSKMLSFCEEKQWKVHPVIHEDNADGIAAYLSHSIAGVVLDMKQEFRIDKEGKTICFKELRKGKEVYTTLEQESFIERYLNHIPPKGAVMIRNYGLYSNRHTEELEEIRKIFQQVPKDNGEEEERTGEESEECCPVCGTVLRIEESFNAGESAHIFASFLVESMRDPPKHGEVLQVA